MLARERSEERDALGRWWWYDGSERAQSMEVASVGLSSDGASRLSSAMVAPRRARAESGPGGHAAAIARLGAGRRRGAIGEAGGRPAVRLRRR